MEPMDFQRPPIGKSALITGAVALLILAGLAGFFIGRAVERSEMLQPSGAEKAALGEVGKLQGLSDAALLSSGGNVVAVNDQPPGMQVKVALVTLAESGWVVICEERDSKPGNILGAQRFNAGEGQSGVVDLLRGTEEEKVYFAVLHADDGDRQFDYKKDLPLQDPQGDLVMMRFVATSNSDLR